MNIKRGQISIFVLFSLVAVIIIFFVFYLNSSEAEKTKADTSKAVSVPSDPIKLFVQLCLKDTAEKGIYAIGLEGGYYYNDSLRGGNPKINVPYYWYQEKDMMPSKDIIQKEIARYVEDRMPECINNFENFKSQGYSLKLGSINADSFIGQKDVTVTVNYPIEASLGNQKTQFDQFSSKIDFDFNEKYNFVSQIMEEQKKNLNSVPTGFISSLAYDSGFTYGNIYLADDNVIYTLVFEEKFKPSFVYNFASKYEWSKI